MKTRPSNSTMFVCLLCLGSALGFVACGRGTDTPAAPVKSASTSSVALGATLFDETCAGCHGATGKGDGPAAVAGPTKPRDLTAEPYKYVRIPEGGSETVALVDYIRVGRIENGMPPYSYMKPEELKSIALFIESIRPEPNFTDAGSGAGDDGG